jgi:hypothetical protein
MSCEQWRERIIDSLANELGEEEAARVAEHVAGCAACAREARLARALVREAATGPEWCENPATRARLLEALRENRGGARRAAGGVAEDAPARGLAHRIASALSRPIPAYAAIALVAVALVFGFAIGPRRTAPSAPHAASPVPAPVSGGEPSGESRRPLAERRFEVTGADAVRTREVFPRDSL